MIHIYARVSTIEQSGPNKTSIGEQIAKCKAVAQMRGASSKYDLLVHADAGVSGSELLGRRPAGRPMIDQLQPGDIVVAAKMDRIFRSGVDALTTIERFKRDKIGLILCDMGIDPVADSPVSTLFFSMLASFAQFERERIRERITDGKRAKRARGGHTGGPVPFGYKKVGEGARAVLVKNEVETEHAAAARYHFNHLKRGPTYIAQLLAEEGMLGRDGKPYGRMAVWRMIHKRNTEHALNG